MENLTIGEAQEKRLILERDILKQIQTFEGETELIVDEVNLLRSSDGVKIIGIEIFVLL